MTETNTNSENARHVFHGYFGPENRLFGHYHAPTGAGSGTAYIICAPLGYEGVHCHHTLLVLACALADAGHPVLRLHYDGTGESFGCDEDPGRVDAWLGSIEAAADMLLGLEGIDHIGLIGIRMGGTLAAVVAGRREISDLVLWEPCVSGAMFIREMQIMASATAKQLKSDTGVVADVSKDPDGLQAGGYLYTPETMSDLSQLKLDEQTPQSRTRTLFVARDDRPLNARLVGQLESAGFDIQAERISGHKEMMSGSAPVYSKVPGAIIARVVEWVSEDLEASGNQARVPTSTPGLAQQSCGNGFSRTVVNFGPGERILGILTEPTTEAGFGKPAVVMYSGGIVPRTAVNRMYLSLADRLATLGHAVLRMDFSGIGESTPAPGNEYNEIFPTSLLEDARSALEFMREERGSSDFWLVGLCSGGAVTFQTCLAEDGILGTVMIDPAAFYWEAGTSPDSLDVKQFAESQHYQKSMLSLSSWLKLLTGRVNVFHILKLGVLRGFTWIKSRWARVSLFGLKRAEGLAPDLNELLHRGVSINMVFSPGHYSYEILTGLVGRRLNRLKRDGLSVERFQGTDHTFNPLGPRERLMDFIAEVIEAREPAKQREKNPMAADSISSKGAPAKP